MACGVETGGYGERLGVVGCMCSREAACSRPAAGSASLFPPRARARDRKLPPQDHRHPSGPCPPLVDEGDVAARQLGGVGLALDAAQRRDGRHHAQQVHAGLLVHESRQLGNGDGIQPRLHRAGVDVALCAGSGEGGTPCVPRRRERGSSCPIKPQRCCSKQQKRQGTHRRARPRRRRQSSACSRCAPTKSACSRA